jgi:hypothetical protein
MMLKLERTAELSSKVCYVCLPPETFEDLSGSEVVASGWGKIAEGGPVSPVLKVATLIGMSNEKCQVSQLFQIQKGFGQA